MILTLAHRLDAALDGLLQPLSVGLPVHHRRLRRRSASSTITTRSRKRSHKGVSGRRRLLAEFVVAGIGCWIILQGAGTELYIPFYNGPVVDLGPSTSSSPPSSWSSFGNAVNLTDGLDGLATMPVIIASLAFIVISYLVGSSLFASLSRNPVRARRRDLTISAAARSSAPALPSCGSTRRRPRSSWAIRAASLWAAHSARSRFDPARDRARHHRRPVRGRDHVGDHPGPGLQAHRQAASSGWRRSITISSSSAGPSRPW